MIITYHREKLINAILYFAGHTQKCGRTKLMKLLYFLDFKHFKETGKSVTGQEYYAWEFGPVPQEVFFEISDKDKMKPDMAKSIKEVPSNDFKMITPQVPFEKKYFSKREMKLLKDIAFIFRNSNAGQMVEVTHFENTPWGRTLENKGAKSKIEYDLAIDDLADSLPMEEAMSRMKEIKETYNAFGVEY